jgi:hypothetical protein
MWVAKKGFENTSLKYKLGIVEVSVNVNEITQSHVDIAKKFGVDLTYYLDKISFEVVKPFTKNLEEAMIEKVKEDTKNLEAMVWGVDVQTLDTEIIKEEVKPKKTRTRKK